MAQFAEQNIERNIRDAKDVICPDKECFLSYHFKNRCTIYLPTNNSLCNIPCETKGCEIEVHKEITCPIWLCQELSTSTSTTSTTSTVTTSSSASPSPDPSHSTPMPEPNPPSSNFNFAISMSFNILLMIGFLVISTWFIRKKYLAWRIRDERRRR